MQSTKSEPYISAVLSGAQTELDLSGDQPFNLSITLTLRARAPLICYIDPENTFFIRRNALHKVGIRFRDQHRNEIQNRPERACTGFMAPPNPERPLAAWSRLYLSPDQPVVFEVFFTGHEDGGCGRSFDPGFIINTSAFETAHTYEATLPASRKISWWRLASWWEAEGQGHEAFIITSMLRSFIRFVSSRWTGDKEKFQGVPVLPENEQLPIYIEGDGVSFSCVGKPMKWPVRTEEEERKFAEERREIRKNRQSAHANASSTDKARGAA